MKQRNYFISGDISCPKELCRYVSGNFCLSKSIFGVSCIASWCN